MYTVAMKQRTRILTICLFLLVIPTLQPLAAQYTPPRTFVISHWGLDEGLPQSSVNSVIQSRDGYLWLATFGGLVRFDGVSFTVFDRSNSPGMVSDRCLKIFEDRDTVLWISTEQGLIRRDRAGFTSFVEQYGNALSGNIFQDKSGAIWVIGRTIFRYDGTVFNRQNIVTNDDLRRRAIAGEGDFWAASEKEILCAIDGMMVRCYDLSEISKHFPWNVVEQPKGTVWVATNGNGIFRFRNGTVRNFTRRDGLPTDNLQQLLVDDRGDVWGAGNGGAARLTGKKIVSITSADGLSDVSLTGLIQDREGNYWAGTFSRGLEKIRPASVVTFGREQGLHEERLLSLAPRNDGGLLIGTNGGGDYEMSDGIIARPKVPMYNERGFIWSIFEDSQGRVWGTDAGSIFYRRNGTKKFFPGFPGKFLYALYEDRDGAMWFGCGNGLFKFFDGKFTAYNDRSGLSSNDVRSLLQDREGKLWIGTTNGLNVLSGGTIRSFTGISGVTSHYFRAIHQDSDGILWFGSYGGGLVRLKDGNFTVYTTADGLFDNIVSQIVEDDSGYFWMGCNRGISRVDRRELNSYAADRKGPLHVVTFGKPEGMRTIETNGGFQPSAVKDRKGNIYFPTVEGLAVIDPLSAKINVVPPPVHIEHILHNGKSSTLDRAEIPFDSTDIEIRYTALSFSNPSKVRFKYRIEGYNSDWIDAGTRRTAYFTKMPPGEYLFRVIACNNDGYWNEQGASVSFRILPPFWMTWWFRTLGFIVFVSLIAAIVRFNEQRKMRQKLQAMEKAAAVERERLRIARDLHDELGARLTEIGFMTEFARKEKKKKETADQLRTIGDTARGIVESFREIVWAVNPQQDSLQSLIEFLEHYLQQYLRGAGIRCRLVIPDELPNIPLSTEQRHSIYMAVKEALNNIVKHSGATEVKFSIQVDRSVISISIEDNGRGFSNTAVGRFSNGLTNMRQRLQDVNGTAEITSVPKQGTTILFTIHIT